MKATGKPHDSKALDVARGAGLVQWGRVVVSSLGLLNWLGMGRINLTLGPI